MQRLLRSGPGRLLHRNLFPLLLVGELCLCLLIVNFVSYTEIDWRAYMDEVGGFLEGERDYLNLRGDTGPLVYPAGFVYLYAILSWVTDGGTDVLLAQYLFVVFYLLFIAVAARVYLNLPRVPAWLVLALAGSKRLHSIFVLRLFNDGLAMLLLFVAVLLFTKHRWHHGCVWFSLAVSIKMNVLLFAPGLLLLLLLTFGMARTIPPLAICGVIQLVLGAPFLFTFPVSYLTKAFELSRVFTYKWTVNFKFLDEETFQSKPLAVALLGLHVALLLLFTAKWVRAARATPARPAAAGTASASATSYSSSVSSFVPARLNPEFIVRVLFVTNFLGITCARTLHYQFYSWYYLTLPFLLWSARLPLVVKLAALPTVEWAFNVFPATPASSLALQACHWVLVVGLFLAPLPHVYELPGGRKKDASDGAEAAKKR